MAGAIPNLPSSRIAVVTGGNKGIGLEVCRQLAHNGITVILTARDDKRGAAAVEKLRDLGLCDVIFHQLEVTDTLSVTGLADFVKTRFGRLDILVNNAAVSGLEYAQDHVGVSEEKLSDMDMNQRIGLVLRCCRETCDGGKECLRTNYYGTKQVIEALLPLLQSSDDGRIVNVSSEYGQLRHFGNEQLKQELSDVENLTEQRLDEVLGLLATFEKDMEAGPALLEARGWPMGLSAYKVSKAALNAYSRVLARRHPDLRVKCVHPGYVSTDMNLRSGFLTPEEGASRVVAVARGAAAPRRTDRRALCRAPGGAVCVMPALGFWQ
ncbi:hypothetical protein EJB05_03915 [Eragrostis curvula]|uniref:Uncharacterized protein n=1 Tax=Eragrostis curvula TaxID=38414 RepID=A0A5J9W6Z8_9POAL|nr:hypothetical protein EJB05_03915 [Eragrostis curvula]